MKPMKHVSIALVLCAIPAMAVAQVTTTCTGCTHALSHYMGSGGFIATATEGTKKVTWLSQCGGVVRTGELTPDDDGMVSALFSENNGLACVAEKASFELGPIMDGGWFWITDEKNSAVGLLVDKEVHKARKDDAVKIASAGDGVKMTAGIGAVYLKETSTGRVGILPNILPKKPAAALRPCGYARGGTAASPTWSRLTSSCQLGDGGAIIVATIPNPQTGELTRVPENGAVVRPAGTGTLTITFDVWMDGSGHFKTTTDPSAGVGARVADARLGHLDFVESSDRWIVRLADASMSVHVGNPLESLSRLVGSGSFTSHGLKLASGASALTMEIQAKDTYCSKTNNFSLPVRIWAWFSAAASVNQVTPPIKGLPHNVNTQQTLGAVRHFTIVCPSGAGSGAASSQQDREIVLDSPFPVE